MGDKFHTIFSRIEGVEPDCLGWGGAWHLQSAILDHFGHEKDGDYSYPWLLCPVCEGEGTAPNSLQDRDAWEETPPPEGEGYQVWETVSEGSPISPVFATPEELARYMAKHWARDGNYEQWLKFINGPGWAPSMALMGGKAMSGVQAVAAG